MRKSLYKNKLNTDFMPEKRDNEKLDVEIKPKQNKGVHLHHHHISLALIFVIILILVILIIIKPAMLGFKIQSQFNEMGISVSDFIVEHENKKADLLVANTNLESCRSVSERYLANIALEKNNTYMCISELSEAESKLSNLQSEYNFNISTIQNEYGQRTSEAEVELSQCQSTNSNIRNDYNSIVSWASTNICCKSKVDNNDIDSYTIRNGQIVCTTGEEDKIIC